MTSTPPTTLTTYTAPVTQQRAYTVHLEFGFDGWQVEVDAYTASEAINIARTVIWQADHFNPAWLHYAECRIVVPDRAA